MKEQIIYQLTKFWGNVILLSKKVVSKFTGNKQENVETKQKPLKVMYTRLCAIYEGDMKMENDKFISVFLLQLQDIDGREYICPLYAEPNCRDSVRANLNKCKPVHMLFDQHTDGGVSFKDGIEIKQVGNNNVVDIRTGERVTQTKEN